MWPDRAYSLFEVKSFDASQRIVEGIASTPDLDRGGDIMDSAGAEFTLPLPFLWFHHAEDPIGEVFAADVRQEGIYIKARVSRVSVPGRLKTLVDDAWAAFTAQPPLVRGLSIGWKPLDMATITGTQYRRVKRWLWGELSAVTVPMNVKASITAVKQFDAAYRAVSGVPARSPSPSGVPGIRPQAGSMTISEQITAEKADLQTKQARLMELVEREDADGGLNDAETTERDALTAGIKAQTQKMERLSILEGGQAALAKGVTFELPRPSASSRGRIEVVKPDLKPGTLFTRYAMAVAAGKGSFSDTIAYARRWDSQTPEVSAYIKAMHGFEAKAIEGTAVVGTPAWGGELAYPQNLPAEFIELLRPMTLVGRITGFRSAPFNVRFTEQIGGSTVNWVGEGAVKPVGELAFTEHFLTNSKIAGIVVLTMELVRLSSPSAEDKVRTDLTAQIAQFMDQQFIDPAVAAGASNPASVTNGVVAVTATGTDAAALYADLNSALAQFDSVEIGTDSLVIAMPTALARGISTLRNALGQAEFPGMTPRGGTLLGYPVLVSNSVPAGTIVLLVAGEIFLADDGRVTLDASSEATLDMNGGATPDFSLWQRNCLAIRAERWIRWQKRRTDAVAMIDTASYGPTTST